MDYKIVEENTYGIVKENSEEQNNVVSAPRLRRGILYRTATELGATKLRLVIIVMIYSYPVPEYSSTVEELKSMPPKLISDDGKQIVIHPLAYCKKRC